jgi:hypothetical protein
MFICEENFICESRELGWAKDKICLMKEAISTRCCPRYILPLIGIESQSKAKQRGGITFERLSRWGFVDVHNRTQNRSFLISSKMIRERKIAQQNVHDKIANKWEGKILVSYLYPSILSSGLVTSLQRSYIC